MGSNLAKRKNPSKSGSKTEPPLLDTLAQLGREAEFDEFNASTDATDTARLMKRARAKYFTCAIILKLVDCDSPLKQSYWNTYHCARQLTKDHKANKITGKYCKNRWCIVCCRIRTAQLINRYHEELTTWDDKHFVTLTIPNVRGEDLSSALTNMEKELYKVRRLMRYHKTKFVGMRKLECTYNATRNDFHPHYHFVVKTKEQADRLLSEWLIRFPKATSIAQDVRSANDNDVFELFKYFTKIISSKTGERKIYTPALDVIFQAVAGRRTFQTFGFTIAKAEPEEHTKQLAEEISEQTVYEWIQEMYNWVDTSSGELLTDYQPGEQFRELLTKNIT